MAETIYTASKARLKAYQSSKGPNWLFLPGGPGLGSESLLPLLKILRLPGSLWLLDLPGDGSNAVPGSFSRWPQALLEAVRLFNHPILAAHSTGGMYALSLPELEPLLQGLVLLDTAPDAGWQTGFAAEINRRPIPGLKALKDAYDRDSTNQTLKALTVASAPYLFTSRSLEEGRRLLASLPYQAEACRWSEEHFDKTYRAKWVPQTIPTLILAGEEDRLTPLNLFQKEKRFHRANIHFMSIPEAGHFPWMENPDAAARAFAAFADRITSR